MNLYKKLSKKFDKFLGVTLTNIEIKEMIIITQKILENAIGEKILAAIYTDGSHHKQWFLFELGKQLGIDMKEAYKDAEEGWMGDEPIAP